MPQKAWHQPLHRRKIWRKKTLMNKVTYYMEPFMQQLLNTWLQPLPFPTIMKLAFSVILITLLLLPLLLPIAFLGYTYAVGQYFAQEEIGLQVPPKLDLLGYVRHVFQYEPSQMNEIYTSLYVERMRAIVTALSSSVDYIRLALALLLSD